MRAIVFDWDGTLVDTLPAILQANVAVLRGYGLPFDEVSYRAAYAPDWRLMYRRLGVPEGAIEAAGAAWVRLYRDIAALRPFPGIDLALRRLASAGHRLGIVTAGDRGVVERQLAQLGLRELFGTLVCGDDLVAAKPDPEPLVRALTELDAAHLPDEAVYVGDAPDDMRMARAVGARGVGIAGALASPGELLGAGADEAWSSVVDWIDAYLGATVHEVAVDSAAKSAAEGAPDSAGRALPASGG